MKLRQISARCLSALLLLIFATLAPLCAYAASGDLDPSFGSGGKDSNQAASRSRHPASRDISTSLYVRSGQTIQISEIIVMLRPGMSSPAGQTLTAPQPQRLSAAAQLELTPLSVTRSGGQILKLPQAVNRAEANNLLQRLRALPEVLWAELQPTTPDKALPQSVLTDPEQGQYTEQIIVKLKDPAIQWAAERNEPLNQAIMDQLSRVAGVVLHQVRPMSGGAYVLRLSNRMTVREARAISERLQQDPAVQYAEPVTLMKPQLTPNDPLFPLQWNYYEPAGGINLPTAWDITTGSPGIVVAVTDWGILPHPDLAGRTVPGYDFVSEDLPGVFLSANDGNGRDSDPTDPGDWITLEESLGIAAGGLFFGCGVSDSSWHGTHVTGIIGAIGNNGIGVAGINWNSKILPVRVGGKCGASDTDIIDGIRWAAGLPVPGAPPNFNPARVINVSLGAVFTPCSAAYQEAINAALMANASVIVAAGNESVNAALSSPANCNGVITVAATRRSGDPASYSNFGASVEVAAPGGDGPDGPVENGIGSTSNDGLTTAANFIYTSFSGTSFAAPEVAGIASLMLSVNPALTPAWITHLIQITARPFAPGTCAFYYPACGAGIIDAGAAVAAARRQASTGPQPGWWWNPAQSGRGFSIEVRGNNMFMAGYLYADDGRATWLVSDGPMTNVSTYSGPLTAFGGGQTLTGPYKSNTLTNPNVGTITLQFSDASHGTLTWPGGTIPIERFPFGSGTASFQPESGWWWNADESGRGFAIEVQGNSLFMAGYMYDSSGNPIWYVSEGGMTYQNLYQGSWLQFANGQTLTGSYQPPSQPPTNVGAVTLQFTSATTAILTLPNGRQIPLTRFLF